MIIIEDNATKCEPEQLIGGDAQDLYDQQVYRFVGMSTGESILDILLT